MNKDIKSTVFYLGLLLAVLSYGFISIFEEDNAVELNENIKKNNLTKDREVMPGALSIHNNYTEDQSIIHKVEAPIRGSLSSTFTNEQKETLDIDHRTQYERYLSGDIELETVDENDDLYAELMARWDGESENITDELYNINILSMRDDFPFKVMVISNKLRMNPSESELHNDFLIEAEGDFESLEYGDYSAEAESRIINLINGLGVEKNNYYIESLNCKQRMCILYVKSNQINIFDAIFKAIDAPIDIDARVRKTSDTSGVIKIFF